MRAVPPPSTTPTGTLVVTCTPGAECNVQTVSEAMAHLTKIYIAGLLILGLFGNVYCVTAFLMPVFRRVPSALYLAALALSDIGFLLTLSLMWLRGVGLKFLDMPHICTTSMFISYLCCYVSSWLVFAITLERYFLTNGRSNFSCKWLRFAKNKVGRPRSRPKLATYTRVRLTFSFIVVTGLILNSWVLFAADSVETQEHKIEKVPGSNSTTIATIVDSDSPVCDMNEDAVGRWYAFFNALDMICSFTLPFIGVLTLNLKIGFRVCKAQNLARQQRASLNATSTAEYLGNFDSALVDLAPIQNGNLNSVTDASLDNDDDILAELNERQMSGNRAIIARIRRNRRDKIERRVTQLLVTASLAYLVLNLPSYVHRVVYAFEGEEEIRHKTTLEIMIQTISYLMFYTQFSINFFLYSCHGCLFGFNC